MSEFRRLAMAVARYRQENDSWPTQARLGPHQIAQILDEYGPSGLERLSEKLDLRIIPEWDISVGGVSVVHYDGPGGLERDGRDPVEAVYRWIGFKFPPG